MGFVSNAFLPHSYRPVINIKRFFCISTLWDPNYPLSCQCTEVKRPTDRNKFNRAISILRLHFNLLTSGPPPSILFKQEQKLHNISSRFITYSLPYLRNPQSQVLQNKNPNPCYALHLQCVITHCSYNP